MTSQAAIKYPEAFLDAEGDKEEVALLKAAMRYDYEQLMTPDRTKIVTKAEVIQSCGNIRQALQMGVTPGRMLAEAAIDTLLPFLGGKAKEDNDLRECALEVMFGWEKESEPEKNTKALHKFSLILGERILHRSPHSASARLVANTVAYTPQLAARAPGNFLLNCTDLCHADGKLTDSKDPVRIESLKAYYTANKDDTAMCHEFRTELANRCQTAETSAREIWRCEQAGTYHRQAGTYSDMMHIMRGKEPS